MLSECASNEELIQTHSTNSKTLRGSYHHLYNTLVNQYDLILYTSKSTVYKIRVFFYVCIQQCKKYKKSRLTLLNFLHSYVLFLYFLLVIVVDYFHWNLLGGSEITAMCTLLATRSPSGHFCLCKVQRHACWHVKANIMGTALTVSMFLGTIQTYPASILDTCRLFSPERSHPILFRQPTRAFSRFPPSVISRRDGHGNNFLPGLHTPLIS